MPSALFALPWVVMIARAGNSYLTLKLAAVGHESLSGALTREPRRIFHSSLGESAIVNTAWIDRPVDTRGLHSLLPRPP